MSSAEIELLLLLELLDPVELYDDEDDCAFCNDCRNCCNRSATELSVDELSVLLLELDDEDEDEPPDGGGPGGGPPAPPGPPGPPPPPGPPLPPGPLAKVLLNTFCNSVAWSLVSLPDDTSFWMRLSIFDLMSPGWDCVPLDWLLELPDCSEELISVRAEDSADSSDELMAPEETSDCSSF